ncbi:3-hydroxyacyl-CoA dehydrogenase NAD-binding domain-containing protein [Massilia sp. YIM B02763]|uniref:3-hydroxyacyl-CoA dehydrogenase NAD-binding domain-containing protein n=1 Tax=Massilia sp. YIM B02763 TaxID=3050130 RepID=UPI0025B6FB25|nr:3-hydroxyacyl-CoA dehydrogenase NAD-binding domain-containing protein [Massilia sp. YIM B02763]MDN4056440.1 3-hydroxyacyl-CoA dehydrogenase NAD-binding domain-containing protein [Massilia sp. YIM B02763]
MDLQRNRSVAIIGAGTIGLSWAVLFATRGWRVCILDPHPDLQDAVKYAVNEAVPTLKALGIDVDKDATVGKIVIATSLEEAVGDVDLVQENGPKRLEWKRELFAKLEKFTTDRTVLASSSSSRSASAISFDIADGSRIIVDHPYNPPHVMPVVEVVPGNKTSEITTMRAMEIYASLEREPILVKEEIPGFVGNRLQLALLREALYLVHEEVIDPIMLDRLMKGSLGVRWAAIGPLAAMRLGGGPAGAAHLMENVGKEMEHIELKLLKSDEMVIAANAVDRAYEDNDYASAAAIAGLAQISLLHALKKAKV